MQDASDHRRSRVQLATAFGEDAAGYETALSLLGTEGEVLIAMEATGHYWMNLWGKECVQTCCNRVGARD